MTKPVTVVSSGTLNILKVFDKLHVGLYNAAMRSFIIPASSVPVEHVFIKGGFIARSHRAKMSDTRLSYLIFLKLCNDTDLT